MLNRFKENMGVYLRLRAKHVEIHVQIDIANIIFSDAMPT